MGRPYLHEWFHDYKFLGYSKPSDGLFCLACTIFPMAAHQGSKTKLLILQPYQNWKNVLSDLNNHAMLQYCKDSMEALNSFVCFQNPNREKIVDRYAAKYPRRMLLQNPL